MLSVLQPILPPILLSVLLSVLPPVLLSVLPPVRIRHPKTYRTSGR